MIEPELTELCSICQKDVLVDDYDYECDMCKECHRKLFSGWKKSSKTKPIGKIKRLSDYE
jgi:hypothetical protein